MPRRPWFLRPCVPVIGLTGMFHCGTSLLLQVVVEVVVGEVLALDLVEQSCDHRDNPAQSSEVPTMTKQMLLSDPILPEKSHQILPHSLLVRRSDNSEASVTGAWNALHLGEAAQPLESFRSRYVADENLDVLCASVDAAPVKQMRLLPAPALSGVRASCSVGPLDLREALRFPNIAGPALERARHH